MNNNEYLKIEKFVEGLRKCYSSKLEGVSNEATIVRTTLNYCLEVLDLHLDLARLEFEQDANQMAADYGEDR